MGAIEHSLEGHDAIDHSRTHTHTHTHFAPQDWPTQLAELSHSEFDQEFFSHSANDKFFCDIRNKSAVINVLRQNETIFDIQVGFWLVRP